MRFDYTGKEVRWIVSVHSDNTDDFYYYHDYAEARKNFKYIVNNTFAPHQSGTRVILRNAKTDERKAFYTFP